MKTLLVLLLALGAAVSAQADPFRPVHRGFPRYHRPVPVRVIAVPHRAWNHYPARPGVVVSAHTDLNARRGDYRANGLFWGALVGAVIGNNSGSLRHEAWRGAAWGAGVGYVLGAVAENNARRDEREYPQEVDAPVTRIAMPAAPLASSPAPATTPQQVTIIHNDRAAPTPMSAANALFGR